MKKLNILYVIDVYGWAYNFNARGQAKYSSHNITWKPLHDITLDDLEGIDILYIHGPNLSDNDIGENRLNRLITDCRKLYPKIKIIGVYSCENETMYLDCDLVLCISSNFYHRCCEMYKRKKQVIFLPKAIDNQVFIPSTDKPKEFIVGWAGRTGWPKRPYLLDQLDFPVKRYSHHGPEYFYKGKSQEDICSFYQSLSCLVLVSSTEALPRTILEAMSCGLAVVSTRVGSLSMLVESEWLVNVNPDEDVVKEMNEKLRFLEKNPDLCSEVGKRNRKFIDKQWNWKLLQPIWDNIFTELVKNHMLSIKIYDEKYRQTSNCPDLI